MSTTETSPATVELNLETLLPWSPAKRVPTKNGDRMLRKAPLVKGDAITENFWAHWRSSKAALRAAGISCAEWQGEWQACWWLPIPKDVLEQEAKAQEMSRATDAEIFIPAPEGYSYLGYQKAGISYMLERYKKQDSGILLGDEMGLGKTIQAIGLINKDTKIQRVLIVCPATLKYNWFKELRRWLVRQPALSVGIADGQCFPSTDIVIINYDVVHKWPTRLSFYWDLIILDECHYLVNPKARRTKSIFGFQPRKNSAEEPIPPINARRKLAMTGTPMVNRTAELFGILRFVDAQVWDNEFAFKKRYCGGYNTGHGWDFSGASNLEELNKKLRAGCMIRRLKRDVLKDLPAKLRKVVELPQTPETRRAVALEREAYSAHQEQLEALRVAVERAKASESREDYVNAVKALKSGMMVAFDEMARVRHMTALAKLPSCIEMLEEIFRDDPEHKIVIFAHHRDVISALKAKWPKACMVVGGMSSQEKDSEVTRFQNEPDATLFLGGLRAAAEGITLTASSHVIFFEEDWTPGKMSQAEDRCHRIGQHDNVLVEHWLLSESLDVYMAETTIEKQEIMDKCLDDKVKAEIGDVPAVPLLITVGVPGADKPRREIVDKSDLEAVKEAATFDAVTEAAKRMTPELIRHIHQGLQMLAGVCNHAVTLDGQGFSRFDAGLGHDLANRPSLSPRQAVLGRKLCIKYKRQLGAEFVQPLYDMNKTEMA